jgi:peroxidase
MLTRDKRSSLFVLFVSDDDKKFHNIDHRSAGVSEKPLPGSMVGPTFGCLMAKQFHNLRFGDRYWYENGGWPSSFTLEQLAEIRKIKLSRLICDNTDEMDSIQVPGP